MKYLLLILIIIIVVTSIKQNKTVSKYCHNLFGGLMNKPNYKEKYIIDDILGIAKSKIDVPSLFMNRCNTSFDNVTYSILEAKKKRLSELTKSKHLVDQIQERNYDEVRFEEALDCEGCNYDIEMELLNSLVLVDEDPILYMPFYNSSILTDEICDKADIIFREELKTKDEIKAKLETIRRLKRKYKYMDKTFVNNIIRDLIEM